MTDQTNPQEAIARLIRWRDIVVALGRPMDGFRNDVLALLSLIEWRPISEARSEDGKRLLLWIVHPADEYAKMVGDGGGWSAINLGYWNAARGEWEHETAGVPTHFLPLLPAPNTAEPRHD